MTPRIISARPFLPEKFLLAEGPFWFDQRWTWVDIDGGSIHFSDSCGKERETIELGEPVGSVVPVAPDHFLAALSDRILWLDISSGRRQTFAFRPKESSQNSRLNDGQCDPRGRFVVGSLRLDGVAQSSSLYSLDAGGRLTNVLFPVGLSNGMAWSQDGNTFYYIDSLTREIARFPYDLTTGKLGLRSVVVRVPDSMGLPDGMTIDEAGNLWVAHWGGSAVRCWCPKTGRCLAQIPLPCTQVTSCAFGGKDLDELLITTAQSGLSEVTLAQERMAGGLFISRPGVRGLPTRTFAAEKN